MPKVRTSKTRPPEGWDVIAPTLEELEAKMREAESESHEGKRKVESLWPIFRLHHQRSRYVYEMFHKRHAISRELYEWCLREGYADANLIAKWKKPGYQRLCCLRCIQSRDTNYGTACICRVPRADLEPGKIVECLHCGCRGCASGDGGAELVDLRSGVAVVAEGARPGTGSGAKPGAAGSNGVAGTGQASGGGRGGAGAGLPTPTHGHGPSGGAGMGGMPMPFGNPMMMMQAAMAAMAAAAAGGGGGGNGGGPGAHPAFHFPLMPIHGMPAPMPWMGMPGMPGPMGGGPASGSTAPTVEAREAAPTDGGPTAPTASSVSMTGAGEGASGEGGAGGAE